MNDAASKKTESVPYRAKSFNLAAHLFSTVFGCYQSSTVIMGSALACSLRPVSLMH